jgi:hypothetical protein
VGRWARGEGVGRGARDERREALVVGDGGVTLRCIMVGVGRHVSGEGVGK